MGCSARKKKVIGLKKPSFEPTRSAKKPKLLRSSAKKSSAKKAVLQTQWSTIPDYFHGLRNKGDDPEILEGDLVQKFNDKGAGKAT